VCACLLKTAEARTGCCTSLLYGMTRASKNNVKGQLTLVGVRELRLAVVISKGSDDGRRSDRERDDQVTQLCGIEDVCHAGVTSFWRCGGPASFSGSGTAALLLWTARDGRGTFPGSNNSGPSVGNPRA
jgi:hypothetical protein